MITFIRHTEAEKVEYNGRNERQRNTQTDRQTTAVTTGSWISMTLCFSMAITTSTFSSWLINGAKSSRSLSRWLNSTKYWKRCHDVTTDRRLYLLCADGLIKIQFKGYLIRTRFSNTSPVNCILNKSVYTTIRRVTNSDIHGQWSKIAFFILRVYCAPNENNQFIQSALKNAWSIYVETLCLSYVWSKTKVKIRYSTIKSC